MRAMHVPQIPTDLQVKAGIGDSFSAPCGKKAGALVLPPSWRLLRDPLPSEPDSKVAAGFTGLFPFANKAES
jgi:hypothetical protein